MATPLPPRSDTPEASTTHSRHALSLLVLRFAVALVVGALGTLLLLLLPKSGGVYILTLELSPLLIGICAALTVKATSRHLIALAVGTGVAVIAGSYLLLLLSALQTDAERRAACPPASCAYVGPSSAGLLNLIFMLALVLVVFSASTTGLTIRMAHRTRRKRQSAGRS